MKNDSIFCPQIYSSSYCFPSLREWNYHSSRQPSKKTSHFSWFSPFLDTHIQSVGKSDNLLVPKSTPNLFLPFCCQHRQWHSGFIVLWLTPCSPNSFCLMFLPSLAYSLLCCQVFFFFFNKTIWHQSFKIPQWLPTEQRVNFNFPYKQEKTPHWSSTSPFRF